MRTLIPWMGKCLLSLGGILALVPAYAQTGNPYPLLLASGRTYKDYRYVQKPSQGLVHDRDGELDKSFNKGLSRNLRRSKTSTSAKAASSWGHQEKRSFSNEPIYYYIAGKPIFCSREDKALRKSLNTLVWMQENPDIFLSRLYNIVDQEVEAEFLTQVFYKLGEHRLTNTHQLQVTRLWDFINQNFQKIKRAKKGIAAFKVSIEVDGYSDAQEFYPDQTESDRKAWNERLSLNRARELGNQLQGLLKKRFEEVVFLPRGKGEIIPPPLVGEFLEKDDERRRMCQIRVRIYPLD